MQYGGIRDLRMIEKVMTHPQWEMPEGIHKNLPLLMLNILSKTKGDGDKIEFAHSAGERMKAARLLMMMNGQNIEAAPPVQGHEIHVTGDLHTTIEAMRKAGVTDDEMENLANTAPVLDRLKALQLNDAN